jgi:Zn-dependent peptidase ImmA (M78 family)
MNRWLEGTVQPTLRQLEDFARATSTPLGLLFLEEAPVEVLPIPHFRTVTDETVERTSPDLLDTIYAMQRRQEWMRQYLIDEGQEPLPFVKSAALDEQPKAIAAKARATLGFAEDWASYQPSWTEALRSLRESMEAAGILVVVNGIVGNNTHRPLNVEEFRGFVLVDQYAPLVFVNGADGKAAQMFTLAHELAHVFLGSSAAFDLRQLMPANDRIERLCNQVAAEFLVPEDLLRKDWRWASTDSQPFQLLARRFKVSAVVVARRALDAGLIDFAAFLSFYREYLADEHLRSQQVSQGGNFYATTNLRIGSRFASAVVRAVREGKLMYGEAYELTGLRGKTFQHFASNVA